MSIGLSQTIAGITGTSIKFAQGANISSEYTDGKIILVQEGILKVSDKSGILILRLVGGEILDSDLFEILNIKGGESILQAETEAVLLFIKSENLKLLPEENYEWYQHLGTSRRAIYKRLVNSICTTNSCMENQIVQYLNNLKEIVNSKELEITHAIIAQDLGSVREVVSRTLKKLEKEGKVELKRGKIILS